MTWKSVPVETFDQKLASSSTEVSSVALGGKILSFSDEWFAPASDLLKVEPAPSLKGQFGPKGALFSGWETRRHNPTFDWVILRLGPAAGAQLLGVDIDTAWFNGNEAPEVEVWGLHLDDDDQHLTESDDRWTQLLHRVSCGPSSRHLWMTPDEKPTEAVYTHVKLRMIPDGGIARFRVYGTITAPRLGHGFEENCATQKDSEALSSLDLAHVLNGGRVVLAEPAYLSYAEIDTLHFLGNFPESVALHGLALPADEQLPTNFEEGAWEELVGRSKMGPHKRHYFQIEPAADSKIAAKGKAYTHVRVTMFPDGGIKRVRLVGRRAKYLSDWPENTALPRIPLPADSETSSREKDLPAAPAPHVDASLPPTAAAAAEIPAEELTAEKYAPYGTIVGHPVQHSHSTSSSQAAHAFKQVNQGTAEKYVAQSVVSCSYAQGSKAKTFIHTYRCFPHPALVASPSAAAATAAAFDVALLERHKYTSQTFLPLGMREDQAYLVIVALNGPDDAPDLSTLKAYVARGAIGITYAAGVWHHPMLVLPCPIEPSKPIDFAVIVNESQLQPELDCDEHSYERLK